MFPIINDIDDLLPYINHKSEISVKVQPNGCTVICYNIASPTTFNDEYARECRGITFDPAGKILARSLHKFFNVGENEQTQVDNIDWSTTARVMDKRDGSMIMAMVLNGQVVCKTKKSFETIQATRALEYINAHLNFNQFVRYCSTIGCTPTFEWTSPIDRIVLRYEIGQLILLHIRDNITGEYVLDLESRALPFAIPVVENITPLALDITSLLYNLKDEVQKEGYVVQFFNGDMVKLKTPWYINLHRTVTFTRERDIAKMIVDETIDDFKSYLNSIGESLDKVTAIEVRVANTMSDITNQVTNFNSEYHDTNRKSFALKAQGHSMFHLIMQHYLGQEPRFREYFIKNHLNEYTLETV